MGDGENLEPLCLAGFSAAVNLADCTMYTRTGNSCISEQNLEPSGHVFGGCIISGS